MVTIYESAEMAEDFMIVGVHYFVRGGFVGYRSRASSKHLSSHLPVDGARFLGGQKGVALQVQDARVGVGSTKKPTPLDVDNSERPRQFPQRLARPISRLLHTSMKRPQSFHIYVVGYGMEARFASHMPRKLTEGTEEDMPLHNTLTDC
ncbi:uncharacterized protein TNCV_2283651 [Trichonephila clavipes]|nr:uncharacterized protein TNCV_2283651 [Trichonephila clavipes]